MSHENRDPQPSLRIIETPRPRYEEVVAEGGRKLIADTGITATSLPHGFKMPPAVRALREAGNEAVLAVERALANTEGLTPADIKQLSALTHALDVSIGVIGGRLIGEAAAAADTEDNEDIKLERAARRALADAFEALATELGDRNGNPMTWHPDASALAAVMMDFARGWVHAPVHARQRGPRVAAESRIAAALHREAGRGDAS